MLIVESYEATLMKDKRVILTFDPPDDFRPAGDLISATVNSRAALVLLWENGTTAWLPDVQGKLARIIAAAPTIGVLWLSDGLIRESKICQPSKSHEVVR